MKLDILSRVPAEYGQARFTDIFRDVQRVICELCEGSIEPHYNAYTAAPTTGSFKKGHFLKNSAPTESGTAGSKYVLLGWVCVTSGTPGTWRECRVLTGN